MGVVRIMGSCLRGRLTHTIAKRIGRYLERQGLLVRDAGNSYLTADAVDTVDEDPFSRGICTQQQDSGAGDAGQTGPRQKDPVTG